MSNIEIGSLQNYQVSLTPDGKVDPLTGMGVEAGFFTTDQKGEVGFDLLHDSGRYKGEVAIFSLDGMEEFTSDSKKFIDEATAGRWYCGPSKGIGPWWPGWPCFRPPDYRFSDYLWHDSV